MAEGGKTSCPKQPRAKGEKLRKKMRFPLR